MDVLSVHSTWQRWLLTGHRHYQAWQSLLRQRMRAHLARVDAYERVLALHGAEQHVGAAPARRPPCSGSSNRPPQSR